MYHIVLAADAVNDIIFIFLWQKRKILQLPFLVFHIVAFRINQPNQMADAPGDDILPVLNIAILSAAHIEHLRKLLGNRRFLRND